MGEDFGDASRIQRHPASRNSVESYEDLAVVARLEPVPRCRQDGPGVAWVGDPQSDRALGRMVEHRRDVSLSQQPAAADDRHGVGDLLHLTQQMTGHQHGLAAVGEAAQGCPHLLDPGRVEAVGRFVEDQQLGVLEQRGRHRQPLPHAEGVSGEPVPRAVGEAHLVQHRADP